MITVLFGLVKGRLSLEVVAQAAGKICGVAGVQAILSAFQADVQRVQGCICIEPLQGLGLPCAVAI